MFKKHSLRNMMARAYFWSAQSPDPSSQNGAIVCNRNDDGNLIPLQNGWNHFYEGIEPELEDRDEKLLRIEHAERDVIYKCAQNGHKTYGGVLVTPWAACCECARAIIGSGIQCVVVHGDRMDLTPERWKPQVDKALGWLEEALMVHVIRGPIIQQNINRVTERQLEPILISGKLWSPETCDYV